VVIYMSTHTTTGAEESVMKLLECKIRPGGFSGELSFQVPLDDGIQHTGLAARQYFWDKDGKPVTQPPARGVDGYVAVRILDQRPDDDSLIVSIPDGEVLKLNKDRILSIPRPESIPHVPVGS
jgi:hypothetical protein